MNRILLFSSINVTEVYKLYEILNGEFLKKFKFAAEFRITTFSSSREFSLSVDDASEEERNWLREETLKIVERKFEKVVDEQ
jgi:hypothetical protein